VLHLFCLDRLLSLDCSARGQRYRDAESGEALVQRAFLPRELVLADSNLPKYFRMMPH